MADALYLLLPARVRNQDRNGATGDSRSYGICAARQNNRHPCTEHQSGAVSICEERELLRQHVSGFQVRDEQNIGMSGDAGLNALGLRGFLADGVVER